MKNWRKVSRRARLFTSMENRAVQCHLSPRNCNMNEGQAGFENLDRFILAITKVRHQKFKLQIG